MRRLKNHANIEKRGNREIREIREPPSAFGGRVWIFRVFGVFRGSTNSLGEDLGPTPWLDSLLLRWENWSMSATIIQKKRQTTLPVEVCEAVGLSPGDQVDWRIEDGEIRGRKIEPVSCEVLDFDDLDPVTLAPKIGMITEESIVRAIWEDREQSR